jgi:hypothetical protein
MVGSLRFFGTCPTCGRKLHIPIELLGKLVQCHGCTAEFRATGDKSPYEAHAASSSSPGMAETASRVNLDLRVESLLEAADRQLRQGHAYVP